MYIAKTGWSCSRSPICARGGTFQARTVHDARLQGCVRTWAPHGRSHPSQARQWADAPEVSAIGALLLFCLAGLQALWTGKRTGAARDFQRLAQEPP